MKKQINKLDMIITIIGLAILRMVTVTHIIRVKPAAYEPKTNFE